MSQCSRSGTYIPAILKKGFNKTCASQQSAQLKSCTHFGPAFWHPMMPQCTCHPCIWLLYAYARSWNLQTVYSSAHCTGKIRHTFVTLHYNIQGWHSVAICALATLLRAFTLSLKPAVVLNVGKPHRSNTKFQTRQPVFSSYIQTIMWCN